MNIAYLSDSIIPSAFANSVNVMKTCAAFSKSNHEVILFSRYGNLFAGDDYQTYGVSNIFSIKKVWRPKILTRKFRQSICDLQLRYYFKKMTKLPDLLFGRDIYSFKALLDFNRPMIYEAHFAPRSSEEVNTFEKVFRDQNFKHLVVISDVLKDDYIKLFPWLKNRIVVAQNATDLPSLDDQEINNWPGKGERLQVGYVGQLFPGKGMEILSLVAFEAQDVDFHIIGGMPKDIEYWKKNYQGDNIYFHGYIEHGKLGGYFQKFDVLMAPYVGGELNTRRSPLKVFEYMARQKPILASSIPIIQAVLRNEETALLIPPEDINAWVQALMRLKHDQALGEKLAKKAYDEFLSSYTWERRVTKILDL